MRESCCVSKASAAAADKSIDKGSFIGWNNMNVNLSLQPAGAETSTGWRQGTGWGRAEADRLRL